MDKITNTNPLSHSDDIVANNIEQLKTLFPEIVSEGKIDFKVLQSILGEEIEEGEEYYRFTWAGKAQARREAHKPSTGTLRPCKEDSVDWDSTQNLYIEGDNLEVLKLLQKSYAGKVKMIFIDPPYNTGKDFVYKDNYKDNLRNYQEITGQVDSDGNKLTTNSESEGRYHSNWLNMMYPRLQLARNLLTDDGVIFISLDDNEAHSLKKLCDEVFGEVNFVADLIWEKRYGRSNDAKLMASSFDHIMLYRKSENLKILREERTESANKGYSNPDNDPRGIWTSVSFVAQTTKSERPNLSYIIKNPNTQKEYEHPTNSWKYAEDKYQEWLEDNRFHWGKDGMQDFPRIKRFLSELDEGMVPVNLWKHQESGTGDEGTKEVNALIGKDIFSYPKPVKLIKRALGLGLYPKTQDGIVLDFFGGSGSTAHAVLEANINDGGNRKFIQIQLPEKTDEKSVAYKAGYKTIPEIGKERIRRAGKKIIEEQQVILDKKLTELTKLQAAPTLLEDEQVTKLAQEVKDLQSRIKSLDVGFKVFKLDSSNIRSWDGNIEGKELEAALKGFIDNTKDSEYTIDETGQKIPSDDIRTQEDIMYEILLKYGLDLTLPIEEREIAGKKVFNVGFGALFICLGNDITRAVAEGIGQWKQEVNPEVCRVVFKDNGFTDVEKTNSVQILKRFGITEIKTL